MKFGAHGIGGLLVIVGLSPALACSAAAPEPVHPQWPGGSLMMAFKPGSCVAGANTLPVSMSVFGPQQRLRYLEPTDGKLQFALVMADRSQSPIGFRWLPVPELGERTTQALLASPPVWNLELSFNSDRAGECLIHFEFQPTTEAGAKGVKMAETTILMTEPPPLPPPPSASEAVTPGNEAEPASD